MIGLFDAFSRFMKFLIGAMQFTRYDSKPHRSDSIGIDKRSKFDHFVRGLGCELTLRISKVLWRALVTEWGQVRWSRTNANSLFLRRGFKIFDNCNWQIRQTKSITIEKIDLSLKKSQNRVFYDKSGSTDGMHRIQHTSKTVCVVKVNLPFWRISSAPRHTVCHIPFAIHVIGTHTSDSYLLNPEHSTGRPLDLRMRLASLDCVRCTRFSLCPLLSPFSVREPENLISPTPSKFRPMKFHITLFKQFCFTWKDQCQKSPCLGDNVLCRRE